jgi:hypothetical protein
VTNSLSHGTSEITVKRAVDALEIIIIAKVIETTKTYITVLWNQGIQT